METIKEQKWANFGIRWGATLVDFNIFLITIMVFPRTIYSKLSDFNFTEFGLASSLLLFLFYIISFITLTIIIRSLFESSKFKGTPGKIAVGIEVVDYNGERISFTTALKRNLTKFFLSGFFYVGYLIIIFSEERQALHDKLAKTYVIRK